MKRRFLLFSLILSGFGCAEKTQKRIPKTTQIVVAEKPEKKQEPQKEIQKTTKLKSFTFASFNQEISRDSNRRSEIIRFDGQMLIYTTAFSGYSPNGRSGEMPGTRYVLSETLLAELENYLESKGVLEDVTIKPVKEIRDQRHAYRMHGFSFAADYDGKHTRMAYSAKDARPRSPLAKEKTDLVLNKTAIKLSELKAFLVGLRAKDGAVHKDYTKEEIEEQSYVRRHGHRPNEVPSKVQRFYFTSYEGKFERKPYKAYKAPQFSANANRKEIVVSHRLPTKHFRADCTASPEFQESFLKLLAETRVFEMKSSVYLSPKLLEYGMVEKKYVFEATFAPKWRVKTYLHFYDTPEVREKDLSGDAWIPKFEKFEKEIRVLLASDECEKKPK